MQVSYDEIRLGRCNLSHEGAKFSKPPKAVPLPLPSDAQKLDSATERLPVPLCRHKDWLLVVASTYLPRPFPGRPPPPPPALPRPRLIVGGENGRGENERPGDELNLGVDRNGECHG